MDLKGSIYWDLFRDCWDFFKASLPVPSIDDAERWDVIIGTAGQYMNKYRKTEIASFATALFIDVIDELDRQCRERQLEMKGGEVHGTGTEIQRSAEILADVRSRTPAKGEENADRDSDSEPHTDATRETYNEECVS